MSECIYPPQTPIWTGLGLNPALPGERPDGIEARTSFSFLIHADIYANSSKQWRQHCFTLKLVTGQDARPF